MGDPLAPSMPWNFVDRATMRPAPAGDRSKIKPLFPDRIAEGKRFFDAHGYIPANHFFAIRGDVYNRYPWAAFNLYRGLLDAKEHAARQLKELIPTALIHGPDYLRQTQAAYGDDPFTYGVEANRPMLEFMIEMSYEQGFIKSKPQVKELFQPEFHPV
jgi:4,5-dihydroxyphthalate decarboxylase